MFAQAWPVGALQPIEPIVAARIPMRGAQQRRHAGTGPRGRQLPAGLVQHRHVLALEQGPHAARQEAVLGNQRDRLPTRGKVGEDLGCRPLGLVLEVPADRDADRGGVATRANGSAGSASLSTIRQGLLSPATARTLNVSASGPPACSAIQADG